ncbi:hypothetical protein [Paracoccus beibuensis]|uniref:hypothetical protein n=1 Tax=Paracoccus beibuensis TaxID=547602 RepID=UPI00223F56D8|nr:hypothetical protein [Paracoccus beibuensis]
MSEQTFRFIFDGSAFTEHEIDVADLAPALLALGSIVRSANKAVNGKRADARLKVKATAEGSFDAILDIDVSFFSAVSDLIEHVVTSEDRIANAKGLTDLLLNVGALGGGLLVALRWLRGRRPERLEENFNDTTTIVLGDQSITVDNRTMILLQDTDTRRSVEDFGKKLERIEGLNQVRFTDGPDRDVVLKKADLPSLNVPELIDDAPEEIRSGRIAWLKLVTALFRDGYVWRFSDGGEKHFTATVTDDEFSMKVANGDVALSASDSLRCRVVEVQKLSGGGLTKDIEVAEVLELVPGHRQLRLI